MPTKIGSKPRPRIAVLGGGMQGVCSALELADRGADVEIIDRSPRLMTGAAISNEGKIYISAMFMPVIDHSPLHGE